MKAKPNPKPPVTRAIFAADGKLDWQRESQGAIPVAKLTLGTPPTEQGGTDKFIETKIPGDLASLFPSLTHLHLWGAKNLEALPVLPKGLKTLDVRNCTNLRKLPDELPSDLEVLDMGRCAKLSSLPDLPRGLRELYVDHCEGLGLPDGKLPKLPSTLEVLDATGTRAVQQLSGDLFDKVRFPELRDLRVEPTTRFGEFEDASTLAQVSGKNGLDLLSRWYHGLAAKGAKVEHRRFVKVFLLGDGCAGKTKVRQLLKGETPDDVHRTTHGAEVEDVAELEQLEPGQGALKLPQIGLAVWDFGGQEIYHGTHALFADDSALYVIVWTNQERDPKEMKRPVQYWLDYVASLREDRADAPVIQVILAESGARSVDSKPDFTPVKGVEVAGIVGYDLFDAGKTFVAGSADGILASIGTAAKRIAESRKQTILDSWVKVRKTIQSKSYQAKNTITKEALQSLCLENGVETDVVDIVPGYLHESGAIFHKPKDPKYFGGKIVVNQQWALNTIYTVLHRSEGNPLRHTSPPGAFTIQLLHREVWRHADLSVSKTLVLMMESCGVCFRWRRLKEAANLSDEPLDWEWIAPEMLMPQTEAQRNFKEIVGGSVPDDCETFEYDMLRNDILRMLVCSIGRADGDRLMYWKDGFLGQWGNVIVTVEAKKEGTLRNPGAGKIVAERFGEDCDEWAEVVDTISKGLAGQRPKPKPEIRPTLPAHEAGIFSMEKISERPRRTIEVNFEVKECGESDAEIVIERDGGRAEPERRSVASLRLDRKDIQKYAGLLEPNEAFETQAWEIGEKIHEALFDWKKARAVNDATISDSVRYFVRLKLRGSAKFHAIPWELAHDGEPRDGREPSHAISSKSAKKWQPWILEAAHSIQRHLVDDQMLPMLRPNSPNLRVLWVTSRRPGESIAKDCVLQEVKGFLGKDSGVEIDWVESGVFEEMVERLVSRQYHVVHLDMHGDVIPWSAIGENWKKLNQKRCLRLGRIEHWEGEMPVLYFNEGGEDCRDVPVRADELANVLRVNGRMPLVVLNACHSGTVPAFNDYGALPTYLLKDGFVGVVAFQTLVQAEAASVFFAEFYKTLRPGNRGEGARTGDPEHAVHMGRQMLKSNPTREGHMKVDWWMPVYYTSRDIRLFEEP